MKPLSDELISNELTEQEHSLIKVGTVIRIEEKAAELLFKEESKIGQIIEVKDAEDEYVSYPYKADFEISKEVLLLKEEVVEIISKDEFPEYYL